MFYLRRRIALLFASLASLQAITADSITPSNDTIVGSANGSTVLMQFSNGTSLGPVWQVLALTQGSRNLSTAISGAAVLATPTNAGFLSSAAVAFVSCDPSAYSGFFTSSLVFRTALQNNVAAVVLYSNTSAWCMLQLDNTITTSIFSSKSRSDTQGIVDLVVNHQSSTPNDVTISSSATPSSSSGSASGTDNNGPLGPSPSTAVAMIALYAITGVITLLFIMIIATGAVRAHRHPERYGPLNGRIRQTRVGGLARAVLESIPVVKFGERQALKPSDLELAPSMAVAPSEAAPGASTSLPGKTRHIVSSEPVDPQQDGGIAAADNTAATSASLAEVNGCSICTEDFEVGQDQRVLPCDHRFHPACVDPWLLNVSGTCPLCRINLHPEADPANADGIASTSEVSPLESNPSFNDRRRRSVLMAITGLRRPEGMTGDERISALRRYLGTNRASPPSVEQTSDSAESSAGNHSTEASGEESADRETRLRQRLSRALNVRTWRTAS